MPAGHRALPIPLRVCRCVCGACGACPAAAPCQQRQTTKTLSAGAGPDSSVLPCPAALRPLAPLPRRRRGRWRAARPPRWAATTRLWTRRSHSMARVRWVGCLQLPPGMPAGVWYMWRGPGGAVMLREPAVVMLREPAVLAVAATCWWADAPPLPALRPAPRRLLAPAGAGGARLWRLRRRRRVGCRRPPPLVQPHLHAGLGPGLARIARLRVTKPSPCPLPHLPPSQQAGFLLLGARTGPRARGGAGAGGALGAHERRPRRRAQQPAGRRQPALKPRICGGAAAACGCASRGLLGGCHRGGLFVSHCMVQQLDSRFI